MSRSPTSTELFSKPRLTVKPTDIFEGDRFELTCSVSIYVPERISNESMRFSIYKDDVKLTGAAAAATYVTVAHASKNGNYTCRATASSLTDCPVEKESRAVVVKAKGESRNAVETLCLSLSCSFPVAMTNWLIILSPSSGFQTHAECGGGHPGAGEALPAALSQRQWHSAHHLQPEQPRPAGSERRGERPRAGGHL